MRLTLKLALALLPGIFIVLAASAYLEMRRDIAAFNIDSRRDDLLIGALVTRTLDTVWKLAGYDEAVKMLDRMQSGPTHQHRLRWLAAANLEVLSADETRTLATGEPVWRERTQRSPGVLFVYSPLIRDGALAGVLEISEPLADERHYAENIGKSTLLTTAVLAAVSLLMTTVLGVWLVGRPIRALIDQARRVGAGDFSGRIHSNHTDEIGELVTEMQSMTQRLASATAEVATATASRIATLEQLRHADRLNTIGKLASGVAHELGTPLNVVTGRAQLILESIQDSDSSTKASDLASTSEKQAHIIIEQAQRMATIIRQLLNLARQQPSHKETCDLCQLTGQTAAVLGALAEKQKVSIAVETCSEPHFALVDPGQIQQVFTNIVVNAIQAMQGGGTIRIGFRPSEKQPPAGMGLADAKRIEVTVQDQGPGMPTEILGQIFEPFFTTKPVGVATGLGLSVAYGIVREHNGFITVESEPGQGACFGIHIPIADSPSHAEVLPKP